MGSFTYDGCSNLRGGGGGGVKSLRWRGDEAMLASAKKFDRKQKFETEVNQLLIHCTVDRKYF